MKAFETKNQLIEAYTNEYHKEEIGFDYIAKSNCKYTPHIYNGGWFIKDYGYSIERLPLVGANLVNNLF